MSRTKKNTAKVKVVAMLVAILMIFSICTTVVNIVFAGEVVLASSRNSMEWNG